MIRTARVLTEADPDTNGPRMNADARVFAAIWQFTILRQSNRSHDGARRVHRGAPAVAGACLKGRVALHQPAFGRPTVDLAAHASRRHRGYDHSRSVSQDRGRSFSKLRTERFGLFSAGFSTNFHLL